MKFVLITGLLLGSLSVFAQRPGPGPGPGPGPIPPGRDNLIERILLLERDVAELQNSVAYLQAVIQNQPFPPGGGGGRPGGGGGYGRRLAVCSLSSPHNGTFLGKAPTALEAKAIAINSCRNAGLSSLTCDERRVVCEAPF